MEASSRDLTRYADLIARKLMTVSTGEQVAIVCDPYSEMAMANALAGSWRAWVGSFRSFGSVEGVLVIDEPMTHFGLPIRPMSHNVKKHRIGSADEDTNQAMGLRSVIENVAEADNLAEFGVGPNS